MSGEIREGNSEEEDFRAINDAQDFLRTQGRDCRYSYRRNGSASRLIIIMPKGHEGLISYQSKQLLNNRIRGLLQVSTFEKDNDMHWCYDISSAVTLNRYLSVKVQDESSLLHIISQIASTAACCEDYLLDSNNLITDKNFIYIDPVRKEVKLAYLPYRIGNNTEPAFKKLFTEISDEFARMGSKLHELLASTSGCGEFNPSEVKKKIGMLMEEYSISDTKKAETSAYSEKQEKVKHFSWLKSIHKDKNQKRNSQSADNCSAQTGTRSENCHNGNLSKYGRCSQPEGCTESTHELSFTSPGTSHTSEEDRTVLLSAGMLYSAYFKSLIGEETLCIPSDSDSVIIGRKKDQADCVIENKAVGKVHAELTRRGNEYFIKDLNSRNGTFVNNVRLEPDAGCSIKNRDILAFANREYIFLC